MSKNKKGGWVAWNYDISARDVAEDIVDEINFMLKEKNIYISSYFDDDQEDWDYKLELDFLEKKTKKVMKNNE